MDEGNKESHLCGRKALSLLHLRSAQFFNQPRVAADLKVWKAVGHRKNHPERAAKAAGLGLSPGRDGAGNGSAWDASLS